MMANKSYLSIKFINVSPLFYPASGVNKIGNLLQFPYESTTQN